MLTCSDVLTQQYKWGINLWQHVCVCTCMRPWGLYKPLGSFQVSPLILIILKLETYPVHLFWTPTLFFNVVCWIAPGLFIPRTEAGVFLHLSQSLFSPSLCHSGKPLYSQKRNDCLHSEHPPPVSLCQSVNGEPGSIAQKPCWRGFHSVWESLPVRGMRMDTRKRQTLRISLQQEAPVLERTYMWMCGLWLLFISLCCRGASSQI